MADLGKMNAAFDLMYLANKTLNMLPHSMHKVYAACVYQQAFHLIYAAAERGQYLCTNGVTARKRRRIAPGSANVLQSLSGRT